MQCKLRLKKNTDTQGGYHRKDLAGDVLYNSFIYRDVSLTFATPYRKKTYIEDATVAFMRKQNLISDAEVFAYEIAIASYFTAEKIPTLDDYTLEEVYALITSLRKKQFGNAVTEAAWQLLAQKSVPLELQNGLNQSEKIATVCTSKEHILLTLTEPELFCTMQAYIDTLTAQNKQLWLLCTQDGDTNLPTPAAMTALLNGSPNVQLLSLKDGEIFCDAALAEAVQNENAFFMIFGEDGLLGARNLLLPCGIFAKPRGFHACALCGQLGLSRPVAVYVPQGYDITKTVPITEKTRLSYLQLAKLEKVFGDAIYTRTPEQLYTLYPQCFFNIYENTTAMPAKEDYAYFKLPQDTNAISFPEFDACRTAAIQKHLESFSGCTYYEKTFTKNDIDGIEGHILVHGVCIKNSPGARIIPCGNTTPLRAKMRTESIGETAVVSNFLFFLTPKLAALYNELRRDRKHEIAKVDTGHLDYLLEYRNGKRIEHFPLFRKTCIAQKADGGFLFFNFRLGGGSILLGNLSLTWEKEAVDPTQNAQLPRICIYTPYASLPDSDADRETYRKPVGKGRINFVILQDRIAAIRDGDVLLPGVGVVLSLEKSYGKSVCEKLNLRSLDDGYYDTENISLTVKLKAPEGISEAEWAKVNWAYGGGLSLILDGVGLCDGDRMEKWFEMDGWTSPLSRQTQESALHKLVKHPRTAIGTTTDNELVVLVFSGRTRFSSGADYKEMCLIARKLIPNIQNLMNVDGGGSAVFGMAENGTFTELSLPSTSTGSTVGMARPIHTALYLPLPK